MLFHALFIYLLQRNSYLKVLGIFHSVLGLPILQVIKGPYLIWTTYLFLHHYIQVLSVLFVVSCVVCLLLHRVDGSHAVGGICKDSGASVMAKSLFASLLLQKPKKAVNFEAQNYSFKTEDCFNLYKPGNMCGQFHDLHRAFCSQSHCKIDIGLHMLQPRMPVYRHKLCTSFFSLPFA